jgi:hypothetical protein
MKHARLIGIIAVAALFGFSGLRAPATHAQSAVPTFRGTANGRMLNHTVDLQPGLVVVKARHAGNANFSLSLILPKPGIDLRQEYEEGIGMINAVGQYNGGAAAQITKPGTYVLDLYASGSYQITVEQPTPDTAMAVEERQFFGKGQQVTPVLAMPFGTRTITFTHDGTSNFQVWLYDLNGASVGGDLFGRLVNVIGPYNGSITLEIVVDGPHLFHINADGNWTMRIE